MSRLRLEEGTRPWLPATDVVSVHEFDHYNIPLSGVVEQSGKKFLFTCLLGEEDPDNIWAYAPLSDAEIGRLRRLTGDALLDAVETALENKSLVVAFADEWRLESWYTIDAGEEGPIGIVKRFLKRWRRSLDEQSQQTNELERKRELAGAFN